MTWKIGDVKVTLVRDALAAFPMNMMYTNSDQAVADANAEWLAPYRHEDGTLGFSVHALIVDTGSKVIVVDTCNGTHASGDIGATTESYPFLEDMAKAGYPPEKVDIVLCTHLHNDHVGWNTRYVDGRWVPTFPRARYLIGKVEFDYWDANPGEAVSTFEDAVRPVFAAGQVDLVETNHRICDEVWLEPTVGHSPGHVSVHIESKGERALITGDALHHPIQFAAPHWKMFLDHDPEQAVATRKALCNHAVEGGVRVFGTHFPDPSSGFLTRTGADSFRFDT